MNLVLGGLGEPLLVTGGLGAYGLVFVIYIDPAQVVILSEDASIGDIDATQVEVIQ